MKRRIAGNRNHRSMLRPVQYRYNFFAGLNLKQRNHSVRQKTGTRTWDQRLVTNDYQLSLNTEYSVQCTISDKRLGASDW